MYRPFAVSFVEFRLIFTNDKKLFHEETFNRPGRRTECADNTLHTRIFTLLPLLYKIEAPHLYRKAGFAHQVQSWMKEILELPSFSEKKLHFIIKFLYSSAIFYNT